MEWSGAERSGGVPCLLSSRLLSSRRNKLINYRHTVVASHHISHPAICTTPERNGTKRSETKPKEREPNHWAAGRAHAAGGRSTNRSLNARINDATAAHCSHCNSSPEVRNWVTHTVTIFYPIRSPHFSALFVCAPSSGRVARISERDASIRTSAPVPAEEEESHPTHSTAQRSAARASRLVRRGRC